MFVLRNRTPPTRPLLAFNRCPTVRCRCRNRNLAAGCHHCQAMVDDDNDHDNDGYFDGTLGLKKTLNALILYGAMNRLIDLVEIDCTKVDSLVKNLLYNFAQPDMGCYRDICSTYFIQNPTDCLFAKLSRFTNATKTDENCPRP